MRFLTADRIFSGKEYLPKDTVLVTDEKGLIKDVVPEKKLEKNQIERLEGILTPGFVNVHCHLELSHLKNKIPQKTGLPGFAMEVIKQRGNHSSEAIKTAMNAADEQMWKSGIVAVGDISNNVDSFKTKTDSKINYHTFVELIGLNPNNAEVIFDKGKGLLGELKNMGLQGSLAPHAPYSTSKDLIGLTARFDQENNLPFTIHNQESPDEARFFMGEQNGFKKLYDFLNFDISWFEAPGTSSLKYYGNTLPDQKTLLIHNTFTEAADLQLIESNAFWCFCPRANKYIEDRLPDFSIFPTENICIGTDSLASNLGLDLLEEINMILTESKNFSIEELLKAITFNGAKALGIEKQFGQLRAGTSPGLNLLKINDSKIQFIKKIS